MFLSQEPVEYRFITTVHEFADLRGLLGAVALLACGAIGSASASGAEGSRFES